MPIRPLNKNGLFREEIEDFTGGINVDGDASKIKESEFQNIENLITYKNGRIGNLTKRNGFNKYDAVTSAGASVLGIFEFAKYGSDTILLVKSSGKLEWKKTTGAYNSIDASDVTGKSKFLKLNDVALIFNRNSSSVFSPNKAFTTFNNNADTEYQDYTPLKCPQTFTAVHTNAVSGGLSGTGQYVYYITYVFIDGTETPPLCLEEWGDYWLGNGAVQCFTMAGDTAVKLNAIPTGDKFVVSKKIYRSKDFLSVPPHGTYNIYYVATIEARQTSYYDVTPDVQLIEPYAVGNMLRAYQNKNACVNGNRLFVGNCLIDNVILDNTLVVASQTGTGSLPTANRLIIYYHKLAYFEDFFNINDYDDVVQGYDFPYYENKFIYKQVNVSYTKTNGASFTRKIRFTINQSINTYFKQYALFRPYYSLPTTVTNNGNGTLTLSGYNPFPAGAGDIIHVEGFKNGTASPYIPDGAYTVVSIDANGDNIVITATVSGTWDSDSGYVYTDIYYITMVSNGATIDSGFALEGFSVYAYDKLKQNTLIETQIQNLNSLVSWSDVDKIFTQRLTSQIQIENNDSDVIRAMASTRDGVYIWKDRNIYKLYTSADPTLWQYARIIEAIGCSDDENIFSLVECGNGEYVWYFQGCFYHWREGQIPRKCSGKIQTFLDGLTFTNLDGAFDPIRNWVIYAYTSGGNSYALIYDLNARDEQGFGSWTKVIQSANMGLRYPMVTKAGLLLFGYEKNVILKYDTSIYQDLIYSSGGGGTYTLTDIITEFQTKEFDINYINIQRLMMKLYAASGGTFYLIPYKDGSAQTTISVTSSDSFVRINNSLNIQNVKSFSVLVQEQNNKLVSYQALGFDFKARPEEVGW
ncbi:hypothetical protein D4R20_03215 [bacterium]|nr:MAG: hypothetical protein D4R20_03215 [bacterium]